MSSNYFANLPSILQPPNFPFWAMDDQSNCNLLRSERSSSVRFQTFPQNHVPQPMIAISSVDRQGKAPENGVEEQRTDGGYSQSPETFASRAEKARQYAMRLTPDQLRLTSLSTALDLWWECVKKPAVRKARTIEAYELYIKNLKASELADMMVSQIDHGHLVAYQQDRRADKVVDGKIIKGACVSYVNHETNTIAQLMQYCDLWAFLEKHFKPLPTPNWRPPKTLTQEEEDKFFLVAASNPDWEVAYWAVSVTNNTSASGVELRTLQLKHIKLEDGEFFVPDETAKNQFRARRIPLNEIAAKQMTRILARADKLGSKQQEHYVFPLKVKHGEYDPTRPASRSYIRHAFKGIRDATGFLWLQPRHFRNQIITKLFENGTPDETIQAIAGHQSANMSRYYSQIRMDAKKDALSALVPRKAAAKHA